MNLNLHLEKEDLISAAKVSVGKDQSYWMDLSHKGDTEVVTYLLDGLANNNPNKILLEVYEN